MICPHKKHKHGESQRNLCAAWVTMDIQSMLISMADKLVSQDEGLKIIRDKCNDLMLVLGFETDEMDIDLAAREL